MKYKLSKKIYFVIFIILAISAFLRIINIEGDAPVADISRSGVFYVDEGTYTHNAVNKILYDEWFLSYDYNPISNVPLYSIFQYSLLKILGISIQTVRFTSVIYSILSILLLWIMLKKFNPLVAILTLILAGSNYFFIIYNRLALVENLLILFLIIESILIYQYSRKGSWGWLIASIVIFWSSYFIKPTILFFMPILIISIIYTTYKRKTLLFHLYLYFAISSLILLIIYYLWVVPHISDWHYFEGRNIHQYINESFLIFLMNYARYFTNLKLFQFMPITYSLFLLYLTYVIYEIVKRKRVGFIDWFFTSWTLCAFLFLGFFKYSPPRHSLILVPAILVLCSSFIIRLYNGKLEYKDKSIFILVFPTVVLVICQIFFGIYRMLVYEQEYLSCYIPIAGFFVIGLYLFYFQKWIKGKNVAILLLTTILIINGFQIIKYHSSVEFSYYNAIRDMKKLIHSEDNSDTQEHILLGDIAPLVSIETKTRALSIIFKDDTESDRIISHCPNFLILQDRKELERLSEKLPTYFDEVELISSYEIFNNYLNNDSTYFYRINNECISEKYWVKR